MTLSLKTVVKPLVVRRVTGHSMLPTYKSGQYIIASSLRKPKVGRAVIAKTKTGEVVKRVSAIDSRTIWLVGDNKGPEHNMKVLRSSFVAGLLF